jgi:uncharacterized membrane protein YhhN
MRTGHVLVIAAVAVAASDWVAVKRSARRMEWLLKPLALAVLVAAGVALRSGVPPARWAFTVAALVLSLVGDVFLLLPDRFVEGLAAFLLAHLAYVGAFNRTAPPLGVTLVGAAMVAVVGGVLFARMRARMVASGQRQYVAPVAAYVVAIGAMWVSALGTIGRPDWTVGSRALAIAGATLFFVSDALIGWTRFVRDVRGSRVAIIVTYHLAQAALVLSLLR